MTQPNANTLIKVSPDSAAIERWVDRLFGLSVLLADSCVLGVNVVDVGCDIKLTFLWRFVASLKKRRWRDEMQVKVRTSIVRKILFFVILMYIFRFLQWLEKYFVTTEYISLLFIWFFPITTSAFMLWK